jgi:hypothetical protein
MAIESGPTWAKLGRSAPPSPAMPGGGDSAQLGYSVLADAAP